MKIKTLISIILSNLPLTHVYCQENTNVLCAEDTGETILKSPVNYIPTLALIEKKDTCRSRAMVYLPCNIFSFWDASISGNPALGLGECGHSQALASESDLHLNAEPTKRTLR